MLELARQTTSILSPRSYLPNQIYSNITVPAEKTQGVTPIYQHSTAQPTSDQANHQDPRNGNEIAIYYLNSEYFVQTSPTIC